MYFKKSPNSKKITEIFVTGTEQMIHKSFEDFRTGQNDKVG